MSEDSCEHSAETIGLCVTSSGKPSLRPFSWRGWDRRTWIVLLFGTISRPLMATHGAGEWISSLGVIHASRSALQVRDSGIKTLDTFGLSSPESYEKLTPSSASSRTCLGIYIADFEKSETSFKKWVTKLRRVCLQRRRSGRRTEENGSSFWPTPTTTMTGTNRGGSQGRVGNIRPLLGTLVRDWTASLGHQAPRTDMGGPSSSKIGQTLNPRFVEILMGWPIGWTDLEPAVTEWSQRQPNWLLEL